MRGIQLGKRRARVLLCLSAHLLVPGAALAQTTEETSAVPVSMEPADGSTNVVDPQTPPTSIEPLPTIPVNAKEPQEPVAPPERAATRLDDVIVTATKRQKSARDIPVTVNAYTGEDLVRRGATNLEELVKLQPGTTKNGNRVVMRGVATSSTGTYVTSEEVGRFLGDVSMNAPSTRGALADIDPFDMQSIEVAKGPQGTLFGGTALAGAVRFIPNKPDPFDWSGALRLGIGSVAHSGELQQETAAMLNGGFDDSVGLRLVGSWRKRPGAIDDLYSGEEDIDFRELKQWRALATWQPTSSFSVDAIYLSWREEQGDLGFTDRPDRYETRIRRIDQPSFMKASLMSLRAEYRWDALSLIGIASELKSSWFDIVDLAPALGVEGLGLPVELPLPVDVNAKVPTYELRIVSNGPSESGWWILRNWDYLAGVFLMQAEQFGESQIVARIPLPDLPELPLPLPLPDDITVALHSLGYSDIEERAFFFDTTRSFFNRHLELNLGGRLAESRLRTFGYINLAGLQLLPERSETEDRRFNPKAALTWRLSKTFSIYGSAAQGFRYGGVNGNLTAGIEPSIPRTFESDSLWNYEVGLRTDWFDRTLRFDVTAFRINWKDLQIVQISTTQQNFVSNLGAARILGAEAGFAWRLPDLPLLPSGLSVSLGGSYIDARITEHFESTNGPVEPGTRLPLTPYVLATGSLNWGRNIGSWLIGASVTDAYSGERKNELVNTVTLPAYHSLGATIRLSNSGMRFRPELGLSGTNVLDKPALNFAFPATLGSNRLYVLNRPRTLLLSLQLSF